MGGFIIPPALEAHKQVLIIIFQISQAWSFTVLYGRMTAQRDTGKWSNYLSVRTVSGVKSQINVKKERTQSLTGCCCWLGRTIVTILPARKVSVSLNTFEGLSLQLCLQLTALLIATRTQDLR